MNLPTVAWNRLHRGQEIILHYRNSGLEVLRIWDLQEMSNLGMSIDNVNVLQENEETFARLKSRSSRNLTRSAWVCITPKQLQQNGLRCDLKWVIALRRVRRTKPHSGQRISNFPSDWMTSPNQEFARIVSGRNFAEMTSFLSFRGGTVGCLVLLFGRDLVGFFPVIFVKIIELNWGNFEADCTILFVFSEKPLFNLKFEGWSFAQPAFSFIS